MPGSSNVLEQVKQFWGSRTGLQKSLLLGGAVATALMLTLFVRLIGTPDYKPLYQDLEPADAQALATQLDAQNIPHQISADGKVVSVPADKLDAARLLTATQGQPHSGRMGFELFDKMSWGQTEFDEKVAYQRALEGELERTIGTLADVEQARVHLVMPTDSVFLDRQRGAKAAVILRLRHNGLSKDAVVAISRLVSGAVDELKPEDVSIIDADSERSLGLAHDGPGDNQDEEARLTNRLINTLEPVVGTNAIRASVNVEFDEASTDENDEKYDPSVSALLTMQRTEDTAGGSAIPSGVPGTSSNIPTAKPAKPAKPAGQANAQNTAPAAQTSATNSSPSQSSKTESAQYGVNKSVIHTITPAGGIRRISAALLVDDTIVRTTDKKGKVTVTRQKRSQDELNKIQELAEAAIGFDAKRGDTISVQNLSFDSGSADTDVPAPTLVSEVQKTVSDYSSLLRPLSILGLFLLAYFLVIRPVQKQALRQGELTAGMQPALASANVQGLSADPTEAIDMGRRAAQLKAQSSELAKQNPADTARAMQAWMREERS